MVVRVASWNVNAKGGIRAARMERVFEALVALDPDVIALQEVSWKSGLHDTFARHLGAFGWPYTAYSGVTGSPHLTHGNLIASRHPVTASAPGWAPDLPFAESALEVSVDLGGRLVGVISAHVPNGSSNGWLKIDTFEALAAAIKAHSPTTPLVVLGDFNEPEFILEDGTVIPFAMRQNKAGEWVALRTKTARCGDTFPGSRWVDGVRAILGHEAVGGLGHVARLTEGAAAWHTTHVVRGRERFFDHILVSPHLEVEAVGYEHGVRADRTSDHSLVWSDLQLVTP